MLDIIKTLIEKPENIRGHIIDFFKICLSVIIASKLYEYFYGKYSPILIGDKNYWKDMYIFFISGRILIVSGIFFVVKKIVFDFLSFTFYQLLNKLAKIPKLVSDPREYNDILKFILKLTGVLIYDNKFGKYPLPGRNFNIALKLIEEEDMDNLNEGLFETKHTIIFEVFNLYFVFSLVYFFALKEFHLTIINILMIFGFIFFFFQLLVIEFILHFLEKTFDDFFKSLRMINQLHITNTFLTNHSLIPKETLDNYPRIYHQEIKTNKSDYYILHYVNTPKVINNIRKLKSESKEKKILLIVDNKNRNQFLDYIEKDSIEVIRFTKKEELVLGLENTLFSDFLKK